MRRVLAIVVALVAALAACGDDDDGTDAFIAIDGSPRVADHAGVLTALDDDFATMTVGTRTFQIDPDVQSFSTLEGNATPLRRWVQQYVLVGLDDDEETVEWMAGVSAVVRVPDEPASAFLTDVLTSIDDGRAVFRSGTTLPIASGVEPPSNPPVAVTATIDVDSGAVVQLVPA